MRTWQQKWDADRAAVGEPHSVTGRVWSDAFEAALAENKALYVPAMDEPIYIDRPIVLSGGHRLTVHPATQVRLVVGAVGTCMVRNAELVFAQDRPVELCAGADEGILIEGGSGPTRTNEGRGRSGAYDQLGTVRRLARRVPAEQRFQRLRAMRRAGFRDCSPFAATDRQRPPLRHREHHLRRDGRRHPRRRPVGSAASSGTSAGKTNDDAVALNAWDWDASSDLRARSPTCWSRMSNLQPGYTWSELRLLPGTKVFADGATVDCDIRRCVYRNIRGVHTFKMYDQPNLGKPELDFADPIGKMAELYFRDIVVDGIHNADYYDKSSDGVFDIWGRYRRHSRSATCASTTRPARATWRRTWSRSAPSPSPGPRA